MFYERWKSSYKSSSDTLKILSVLDKHIPPTSDGGVIARIRRVLEDLPEVCSKYAW